MPSGKHTGKGKKCPPGCTCGRHKRKQRPETRKKISEGLLNHYRERGPLPPADTKKCNDCKQWKKVPDDFYMKKHKLKSGATTLYPDTCCKKCRLKRNREYVLRMPAKERTKMWRRQRQSMIDRHGIEEIRRKEREKRAIEQDKKSDTGLAKLPKRQLVEHDGKNVVNRMPIARFMESELKRQELSVADLAERMSIDDKRLHSLMKGYYTKGKKKYRLKQVGLDLVDRILVALDCPEQMNILYPE